MTETETEMSPHRHLAAVPDDAETSADGVPVGVVWQEEPSGQHTAPPRPRKEDSEEPAQAALAPLEQEPDRAGWASGLGEQTKNALATGHTYARLAWARRWETSMRYVMDPALREEMLDAAEESLDEKRRQAAKKEKKAVNAEDKKKAKKGAERLDKRQVSEMEVDARCLRARGMRLATQCAVPAVVILGPVLMATSGMWWALAAWPAAWSWLAMQGRALLGQSSARAQEVPAVAVTGGPGQARVAPAAGPAPPAPGTERVVGASEAENTVLARLEPGYWSTHAKKRGLAGLTPGAPTLGVAGVQVPLHLGGTWTPAKVRSATGQLRAMLAVPEGAGVQVAPAATGEDVVLRMRTRTPEVDTAWRPGRGEIALVPETGAGVELSPYGHRLVAGVTGAGKSTAMRSWMARAVMDPRAALVFLDPKGQEAGLWEHCARTVKGAGSAGYYRLYQVICELEEELSWRQEHAQGTDWTPTEEHPELVIAIDEGAALVRMSKQKEFKQVLAKVEYLVSQGRAGGMWVHWATQYPTKADGIPAQVTENITHRLALNTGSSQADRVVFGEQATATGWTPSELDLPGWAMLRTGPRDVPEHLALVYMRDEQVRALPAREPWHHGPWAGAPAEEAVVVEDDSDGEEGMPEALAVALQLCQDLPGVRSEEIAESMGAWDILQIQNDLRDAGVKAGRYSDPEEGQVRGYRREDLQAAAGDFQ